MSPNQNFVGNENESTKSILTRTRARGASAALRQLLAGMPTENRVVTYAGEGVLQSAISVLDKIAKGEGMR